MGKLSLGKCVWVAAVTLLLALVLPLTLSHERKPLEDGLRFRESVRGMELRLFHDESDDVYYLFLPAYVSEEQVEQVNKPKDESLKLRVMRGGGPAHHLRCCVLYTKPRPRD
ncbi:MAG: hypothetical protein LUC86_05510, partial [Prevotellaceae bacterium]|nr:hypothetical protein [Prevotellaceae bacterium]